MAKTMTQRKCSGKFLALMGFKKRKSPSEKDFAAAISEIVKGSLENFFLRQKVNSQEHIIKSLERHLDAAVFLIQKDTPMSLEFWKLEILKQSAKLQLMNAVKASIDKEISRTDDEVSKLKRGDYGE